MTSIVVAVALAAAAGPEPDAGVVPAGFFPGGGGAWSGTTSYYGFGREAAYGTGIGPEWNNRPDGFGRDGRRFGAPYSPSPYDQAPARTGRTGGWVGGGVSVGGYSGAGFGGGIFRRR
ncbi:hypothetical protein [Urbifossiella limnaea]|uniref:Uncharacterized protein n=1 Tax=Urbifossiella limnaea TaxID=2528023 RepID=A0A517XLB8_9BACT|nr:hypothetical protein [Urbifossiella limnaea]QDU18300.1 hypothetical protein ETAA1_01850 [Urbifossiella limnaea]